MPQLCKQLGCRKGASFGPKDSKTPHYCATHKPVDYVNVKTQCREDGCYKFPHFGFPGSIATSCVTHMKEGMIHLRTRKCLEPGCNTRAVFNVVGSDKGKFCAKHRQSEMIDIQTKLCKYTGCQKKALFAVEGSPRTFCGLHKQDGMINVASRKCAHSGCYTRPYFNVPGKIQGQYCVRHKTADMVNVVNRRCEKAGCMTIPSFNLWGEKSARFCEAHRNPGMVNVIGPKCNNISCQKRALYGIPGYKMSRCFTHKDQGMIAQSLRLCMISDCKKPATHGLSNPTRCENHSTEDMIDLVQKMCSNCGLPNILIQDNKCADCNTYAEVKVRVRWQNNFE
jgi:hypothetical protein